MKRTLLLLAILFSVISLHASPMIMDAKTLATELKENKDLIIIDVQAPEVYAKQHIKGAINIPHKSLYKSGPVEGQFLEGSELAAIFEKKGLSNSSRIVLYDDGSQKYNTRVWWILKYLGATDVRVFHKDMAQLEAARIPLTTVPVNLTAKTFEVSLVNDMNIDMASLKSKLENPGVVILDAREKDEYDGADKAKKSNGHLPGAVFMNFKEVLTATGAFKSKEEIIATAAKFGATPEKEIVIYCQTGIKASVTYFALKEIAGFNNVKLYAGAYAEWATLATNPVVK